jgi:hypothetical protein
MMSKRVLMSIDRDFLSDGAGEIIFDGLKKRFCAHAAQWLNGDLAPIIQVTSFAGNGTKLGLDRPGFVQQHNNRPTP